MLRLGLRLTLRSGREALVRLAVTTAAVAVGVALLLGVLAEFHAFQAQSSQPCWACTSGNPVPSTLPASGELLNNSVDFYQLVVRRVLDSASIPHPATLLPDGSPLALSIAPADNPFRPVVIRGRVVEWSEGDAAWPIIDQLAVKYTGAPYRREQVRIVAVVEPERQTVGVG